MLEKIKGIIITEYIRYKWRGKLICSHSARIHKSSIFEGANRIYDKTYFKGYIGFGSYISKNVYFNGKIGRFTSIAPFCNVIIGAHPYKEPFVTTCPMFFSLSKQNGQTYANKQLFNELKYSENDYFVVVGSDCWIGSGVKMIQGIKIDDGAMVLAGSIVTKDVPPYAIVGGIPAKIIGYRYDEETIRFLLRIKWWNNSNDWFKKNWKALTDINILKKMYEKE